MAWNRKLLLLSSCLCLATLAPAPEAAAASQAAKAASHLKKAAKQQLKQLQAGTSGADAVTIAKEFIGPSGGLILDVKSTYSTPADIAAFVKHLRGEGINVFGVGTFKPEQLAALGEDTRKVTFFHGINDMESKASDLQPGADVMFNGGSLLEGGVDAVGRKVTEEATEVLLAAKDDAVASSAASRAALAGETADLLYHALVLLAERGVPPSEVIATLRARHGG